ncbi:DUF1772 domain-containing protein [Phragmitibacter flavus]|uniref:DUF1772 domain-containing protein n=1 Tax=Phragmitibacter flavus TaxID=2576071 RepID=A0A5R8KJ48_9BACT|nr:anthrone oxygenase family protein [Phragmitibacter flavus]TLD72280.1 DUF1772 domain-containing protein [Phragmitibacter flavus]
MNELDDSLRFVAALGCGLMAGVFFAFSTLVMKALGRLPTEDGIAAMQAINVGALKSWFLPVFMGTALLCLLVLVGSFGQWGMTSTYWSMAGAALYLGGTFLVTVIFNVPLNDALAGLTSSAPERTTFWANYQASWNFWNYVRTMSSLAGLGFLMMGFWRWT